jgi:hypothetical protein
VIETGGGGCSLAVLINFLKNYVMPVRIIEKVPPADYFAEIDKGLIKPFLDENEQLLNQGNLLTDNQVASIYDKNQTSTEFQEVVASALSGRFLPQDRVREMTAAFNTKIPVDFPDTAIPGKRVFRARSCWYSVSEILAFLKQNNIDPTDPKSVAGKGMRLYFGLELGPDSNSKMTTILVPTVDVDMFNDDTNITETIHVDNPTTVSIADGSFNHGELCPTKCFGTKF